MQRHTHLHEDIHQSYADVNNRSWGPNLTAPTWCQTALTMRLATKQHRMTGAGNRTLSWLRLLCLQPQQRHGVSRAQRDQDAGRPYRPGVRASGWHVPLAGQRLAINGLGAGEARQGLDPTSKVMREQGKGRKEQMS